MAGEPIGLARCDDESAMIPVPPRFGGRLTLRSSSRPIVVVADTTTISKFTTYWTDDMRRIIMHARILSTDINALEHNGFDQRK